MSKYGKRKPKMGKVVYVSQIKEVVVPGVGKVSLPFHVYKEGDDTLAKTNLKLDEKSQTVTIMDDTGSDLYTGEYETNDDGCILVTIDKTSEVTPFASLRNTLFNVWKDAWKPDHITDLRHFFECIIPGLSAHQGEFPMMHTGDSNTLYGPHTELFQNIVTVLMFRAIVSQCINYNDLTYDTMRRALLSTNSNPFQASHDTAAPQFLLTLRRCLADCATADHVLKVFVFSFYITIQTNESFF